MAFPLTSTIPLFEQNTECNPPQSLLFSIAWCENWKGEFDVHIRSIPKWLRHYSVQKHSINPLAASTRLRFRKLIVVKVERSSRYWAMLKASDWQTVIWFRCRLDVKHSKLHIVEGLTVAIRLIISSKSFSWVTATCQPLWWFSDTKGKKQQAWSPYQEYRPCWTQVRCFVMWERSARSWRYGQLESWH